LPELPPHSATPRAIARGIGRMFTEYPYWDVSYLVAVFFSIGCAIFIVCGLFYWLPIAHQETEYEGEDIAGGGVTSFVGATLFHVGAVLLAFEACNENQTGLLRTGSTAGIRRRRDGRAGRMTRYIHRSRTGEESPWMPTSPPPPAPEGAVHAPSAGTSLVLGLTRRGRQVEGGSV
jgi:hypothetical protein